MTRPLVVVLSDARARLTRALEAFAVGDDLLALRILEDLRDDLGLLVEQELDR